MGTKDMLDRLANDLDGKIEEVGILPDGSGFATMTMPLPEDHWLYTASENYEPPPMLLRVGKDHPDREKLEKAVWAAAKYAIRAATMNGKEMDFDPDALCQNMVVGLLGYHTGDGLTDDEWANPNPWPPHLVSIEIE